MQNKNTLNMSDELESRIIERMLNKAQQVIDEICEYINYEKISFSLKNDSIFISTKNFLDISEANDCEEKEMVSLLVDIVIKIIDETIQCNLIFVDETYYECIRKNFYKIEKISELLNSKYKKVLAYDVCL